MDAKTMRGKSVSVLTKELKDAQIHLKELQFKLSSNQLKNVREVRLVKHTIARLKTVLTQMDKQA